MLIVAGLSLRNLEPRVWDPDSQYYLADLRAVMVSYADFHRSPKKRRAAMKEGLHACLGAPQEVKVYLDNGAFYFLRHGGEVPRRNYRRFVERAKPDWWPIPQDFIPTPKMSIEEQKTCFTRTMRTNRDYRRDGYVPVIHVSRFLQNYTKQMSCNDRLSAKPCIALGAIVPNLLRASKAISYEEILTSLAHVREIFHDKHIHVFGIGGTATLHLAALLGIDSVDSSGWRSRAAYGLVQLPGTGDRTVAPLGNWRGREPSAKEWARLGTCHCPACQKFGLNGLKASGLAGASNRATHNLWVLLQEAAEIKRRLGDGTYASWYEGHLDNTIYLPLIRQLIQQRTEDKTSDLTYDG